MKKVLLILSSVAMFSFDSIKNGETVSEDFGDCPPNSTEVVASCTSGCYSTVILGVRFGLTTEETEDAENRLQNWCNRQSLMRTSFDPPAIL